MKTLIDGGSVGIQSIAPDAAVANGSVVSCWQESGQGMGCELCEWAKRLFQDRLVGREGWISVCPRPKRFSLGVALWEKSQATLARGSGYGDPSLG